MTSGTESNRTLILAGIGAAVLVTGAVSAYYFGGVGKPAKATPPDPNVLIARLEQENLSEEERRAAREQMREAMQARMDTRLDEFFNAGEADRQAVLDRHLDEIQKEMAEFEKRRAEWEKRRQEREAAAASDPNRDPNAPREQRWQRPNMAAMTPQERKERAESRDPDRMGRMMSYMAALRARAEQRGIQMPQWGPPGGGMRGGPGRP
jgi:hypothetical protein